MVVGPHLHSPGMWCKCSTLQRRPRGCLPVAEKSSCDGWALIGKEGSGKSSSTCKICQTNQQPSTHHVCVCLTYTDVICAHTHTHNKTHMEETVPAHHKCQEPRGRKRWGGYQNHTPTLAWSEWQEILKPVTWGPTLERRGGEGRSIRRVRETKRSRTMYTMQPKCLTGCSRQATPKGAPK